MFSFLFNFPDHCLVLTFAAFFFFTKDLSRLLLDSVGGSAKYAILLALRLSVSLCGAKGKANSIVERLKTSQEMRHIQWI